jgi:murein DD-endopeptidase MepM/ murein hydrolase activator NlpD
MRLKKFLLVSAIFVGSLSFAVPAFAVTQDDVDQAKEKVSNTQVSLTEVAQRYAKALGEVELLKEEIRVAKENIRKTKKEIKNTKEEISARAAKVYTEKEEIEGGSSLKDEEKQYLTETVVGSQEDLLTKMAYLEESLAEQQKVLDVKKDEQEKLAVALEKDRQKLEVALDEARKSETDITQQLAREEAARKAAEEARKAQEAAMRSYQQAKKSGTSYIAPPSNIQAPSGNGVFIFPTPGRITSGFGYRVHPIYGSGRMHTGIDISAPYGQPIFAAGDGIVSMASYYGGYGNAVIILHGGGLSTLYGHQSRLAVSPGQAVSRGQIIGYVGSTGASTGNHLHFEVMVGGSKVNPLAYL